MLERACSGEASNGGIDRATEWPKMSLCVLCAQPALGRGDVCAYHLDGHADDWATGNRIMCDFLSPDKLMQDWVTIERGIKTWLRSGHLKNIIVEFFKPGAAVASARWEFPIGYDGTGVHDDMWLDKSYLR